MAPSSINELSAPVNILLLVIREIQEKSMNIRFGSLSYAALPLFLLPWHWLIHSPHFSLAFDSPDSVTISHTM